MITFSLCRISRIWLVQQVLAAIRSITQSRKQKFHQRHTHTILIKD
uniref:Uncharacterized protein n=1 Tax=Manihot esculenta TaxID=3983 RepID=A0A2C9WAH1_MANES